MKRFFKGLLYTLLFLVIGIVLFALVLAFLPTHWRVKNMGITQQEAATMRNNYTGPHATFKTSDGETLFLRRWNPDTLDPAKKDIAVLLFHGFTAYSGAYNFAAEPIAKGGYTVFGLDYRGHGLSGGNRGDSPGKNRFIADLGEAVTYVKSLGYKRVVVMGHSLGVASAICAADTVPNEISGLILLSGAYEGRPGLNKPIPLFTELKILSSSIFRPSYPAVEYYREGMHVSPDTLFTFRYTLRFMTMLDVKKLRVPPSMNVPTLVGVGDHDELFAIDKVKDFYNMLPGNQKTFFVMKNATHAKIPVENWEWIVGWLNKTYVGSGATEGKK
jgi:alpha-beta hydrolase superfamily lysophospholipase